MKEYKVEALRFIQKLMNSNQMVTESKDEIQAKLDEYASKGYRLTSTTSSESNILYLFFERDI